MTKLSPHFTLHEFEKSAQAKRLQIENKIPENLMENAYFLAEQLENVRAILGAPIIISSGYRGKVLNARIGGSSTSAHCLALAADFTCPKFGTPAQIVKRLAECNIEFDQLILEYGQWVHIGYARTNQHQKILTAVSAGGKTRYLSGIVE